MNPLSTTPAAQTKAASSASSLLGRTVHVKIKPRPRSLAESAQVLRILRRYGEVDVYKHLKVSHLLLNLYHCSLRLVWCIVRD